MVAKASDWAVAALGSAAQKAVRANNALPISRRVMVRINCPLQPVLKILNGVDARDSVLSVVEKTVKNCYLGKWSPATIGGETKTILLRYINTLAN
jgi:hypothetical protein